jgi:hypothetical protein
MDKRAFAYNLLFMFISPVISLIHGIKGNYGSEFKRKLLIVFITIYGSIITISESNDGFRHRQNVYDHYLDLSFIDFLTEIFDILFFIENPYINEDLYIHFVSYLTGGLLGMPWLFFVIVSFIYAYFFSGSIFKLIELKKEISYKWVVYAFILIFILWKNIEGINTVRTWTGMWVLFYACLSYYKTKEKKYLLLMFLPPLIHLSYFIIAIPAWLVLILGVRHKLYIIVFITSFTSIVLNPQAAINLIEKTEVGQSKVDAYYEEKQATTAEINKASSGNTWYKRFYSLGIQNIGINLIAFVLIGLGFYRFNMNSLEAHLFSIGVLTNALSNVSWFLSAVSNRSGLVAGTFILASLVLYLIRINGAKICIKRNNLFQKIILMSSLLFIPFIIYKIADLIYFVSVFMLVFPFIPWFTDSMNYSIREFIGSFL